MDQLLEAIPLAMQIGNSVFDIISNKKFLNNVKKNSSYFLNNLIRLKKISKYNKRS